MYLDVRDTGTSGMGRGHQSCCVWDTQFWSFPALDPLNCSAHLCLPSSFRFVTTCQGVPAQG